MLLLGQSTGFQQLLKYPVPAVTNRVVYISLGRTEENNANMPEINTHKNMDAVCEAHG